jgi:hypothetical protein
MGRHARRIPIEISEVEALGIAADLRGMVALFGGANKTYAALWAAMLLSLRFADPDHVPSERPLETEYQRLIDLLEDLGRAGFHARRCDRYPGGASGLRQLAQTNLLALEHVMRQLWSRNFVTSVPFVVVPDETAQTR